MYANGAAQCSSRESTSLLCKRRTLTVKLQTARDAILKEMHEFMSASGSAITKEYSTMKTAKKKSERNAILKEMRELTSASGSAITKEYSTMKLSWCGTDAGRATSICAQPTATHLARKADVARDRERESAKWPRPDHALRMQQPGISELATPAWSGHGCQEELLKHLNLNERPDRRDFLIKPPAGTLRGKRLLMLGFFAVPASDKRAQHAALRLSQPLPTFSWIYALLTTAAAANNVTLDLVDWGSRCGKGLGHEWALERFSSVTCVSEPDLSPSMAVLRGSARAMLKQLNISGGVDGIITWTDKHVNLADAMKDALGLPASLRYLQAPRGSSPLELTLPGNKTAQRLMLQRAGVTGAAFGTLGLSAQGWLPSNATIDAVATEVGFPCFVKPASGQGQSAGVFPDMMAKVNTPDALRYESRRILNLQNARLEIAKTKGTAWLYAGPATITVETFLDGPEIFAETVMQDGRPVATSLRALKRPIVGNGTHSSWTLPASLDEAAERTCKAAAEAAARALKLHTGVFGLQLVLDKRLGCTFLELNMRPHMWPMLFDAQAQYLFQPDLWQYEKVALELAIGEAWPSMQLGTSPPLRIDASCPSNQLQLFYLENFVHKPYCKTSLRAGGSISTDEEGPICRTAAHVPTSSSARGRGTYSSLASRRRAPRRRG